MGGSERPDGLDIGFFVTPTLFVDVDNSMTIAQEEIFGPVLSVIPYDDEDDAVRIANDSPYGLAGNIMSGSTERALRVARRLRAGFIGINGTAGYGADTPFGGYKASGIGRQNGTAGFDQYTEIKSVAFPPGELISVVNAHDGRGHSSAGTRFAKRISSTGWVAATQMRRHMTEDLTDVDFFRDGRLTKDPYPFYAALRDKCPVTREDRYGVAMVTGWQEAVDVYNDDATFSSCVSVSGPFPGFPVPLDGDDITDLIAEHRDALPFNDQLPTLDPPTHTDHRALLMRLITPKRLKENEDAMWQLADDILDDFLSSAKGEFIADFAQPFTLRVLRICSAYLKRIVRNSSIGPPAGRTAADSVMRTRLWLRLRSNTSTTFSRHTSRTVERSQGTTF